MARVTIADLAATLEQLRAQMAEMSARLMALETEALETRNGGGKATEAVQPAALAPPPDEPPDEPVVEGITEEILLAISAAVGAYLGVRAHIRQIRLVSTSAWAQQGRVSIQASHRL